MEADQTLPGIPPEKAPIPRATFLQRLGAYVIDMIALGLVTSCIGLAASATAAAAPGQSSPQLLTTASGLFATLLPLLYFGWSYSITGETLGKRLMHIRVVSLDGSPLGFGKGIVRALGYFPSGLPLSLGFLWALWDKDKQTWHDKMAGTCVVPASVEPEELHGTIDPRELQQRRSRWLLGLGIPTLVVAGAIGLAFLLLLNKGIREVRAMEPWPSADVNPEALLEADLSPLGLRLKEVQDAQDAGLWMQGSYETGSVASYTYDGQEVAYLWILRYGSTQAGSADYQAAQAWAQDVSNCPASKYAYLGNMGMVQCTYSDASDKVLWNGHWLIDILTMAGTPQPPEALANAIRDALAAHWQSLELSAQ